MNDKKTALQPTEQVDRSLILRNLKLTATERAENHQATLDFMLRLKKSGEHLRDKPQ